MPDFYTKSENARRRREEFRRRQELAEKFGDALGLDDAEPEVLTLDDLTTRAEPSGASSE